MLVEPKLNPVAGAAVVVVAAPKPGAVRAIKVKQNQRCHYVHKCLIIFA